MSTNYTNIGFTVSLQASVTTCRHLQGATIYKDIYSMFSVSSIVKCFHLNLRDFHRSGGEDFGLLGYDDVPTGKYMLTLNTDVACFSENSVTVPVYTA